MKLEHNPTRAVLLRLRTETELLRCECKDKDSLLLLEIALSNIDFLLSEGKVKEGR